MHNEYGYCCSGKECVNETCCGEEEFEPPYAVFIPSLIFFVLVTVYTLIVTNDPLWYERPETSDWAECRPFLYESAERMTRWFIFGMLRNIILCTCAFPVASISCWGMCGCKPKDCCSGPVCLLYFILIDLFGLGMATLDSYAVVEKEEAYIDTVIYTCETDQDELEQLNSINYMFTIASTVYLVFFVPIALIISFVYFRLHCRKLNPELGDVVPVASSSSSE